LKYEKLSEVHRRYILVPFKFGRKKAYQLDCDTCL